jgi:hypothetical protein
MAHIIDSLKQTEDKIIRFEKRNFTKLTSLLRINIIIFLTSKRVMMAVIQQHLRLQRRRYNINVLWKR